MQKIIGFAALLALVGCAHTNHSEPPAYYSAPVATVAAPTHTVEYPCGKKISMHVGEGNIELPKLNVVLGYGR